MLVSLHIENIAVIKALDLEVGRGFTVLTGETGAGKSIIIDSINFLLGGRSGKEIIRSGEKTALVSALFRDIDKDTFLRLAALGIEPDENGELLIQRTLNEEGRSTARVNGRQVNISLLKEAAGYLINIHGQHDGKFLMEKENQILLLDSYAECGTLLEEYTEFYQYMREVLHKIKSLEKSEIEKARMVEMLTYQLKDIDSAKLRIGEEERLTEEKVKLQNIEQISRQVRFIYKALYQNEKGVTASTLTRKWAEALRAVSGVMPHAEEYIEKLESFAYEMEEIARSAIDVLGEEETNPTEALNKIEERLDVIHKLKRKYGSSVAEILEYHKNISEELEDIEMSDEKIKSLKEKYKHYRIQAESLATRLSEVRRKSAEILEEEICMGLTFLEMPKVRFKIKIDSSQSKLQARGMDEVEFLLSANPGEPLRPMSKIASGGELSRIMLAVKSVLREKESTGTIIFDEIDTGVSGKTSQKIGIKLKQTSETCQVICVTHSAQIAALADNHLFISKDEHGGRVETGVLSLDYEDRIKEVARIMGGREITKALLDSAKELIETSQSY